VSAEPLAAGARVTGGGALAAPMPACCSAAALLLLRCCCALLAAIFISRSVPQFKKKSSAPRYAICLNLPMT